MKPVGPKIEAEGRDQGVGSWGGNRKPPPTSYRGLRSALSSPAWFGSESRPTKGFPLFSAFRMASPVVDHQKLSHSTLVCCEYCEFRDTVWRF